MKILIIDNDVSTVTTLKALILSQGDFNIDIALSGKEGLEKMMYNPNYDLVLLDIMMPEISGIDVCKKMTENHKLRDIPVLLMSSALPIPPDEFKTTSSSLGVVKGVLEKPFVVKDLLSKIEDISKR
jgi:two-component system, sensor histidine kinase ChiS